MSTPTKQERRDAARMARLEQEQAEAAAAHRKRRLVMLLGVLGAAAAIVVVLVLASGGGSSSKTPKVQAGEKIAGQNESAQMLAGIPQKGITLGKASAPVTMIEFADLKCPICREYTLQAMPTLVQDYVRTGKMKIEFRNLAFIAPDSDKAAAMAGAVSQQNKLWNFADIFYFNQGNETDVYVTDAFVRKVGGGVTGLDVNKALAQRSSAAVQRYRAEANTLANKWGVTGTPTFVVGPTGGTLAKISPKSLTADAFRAPIEAALKG